MDSEDIINIIHVYWLSTNYCITKTYEEILKPTIKPLAVLTIASEILEIYAS